MLYHDIVVARYWISEIMVGYHLVMKLASFGIGWVLPVYKTSGVDDILDLSDLIFESRTH